METDDTFVDVVTDDNYATSESAAVISLDESEDVDVVSDFTVTEPESSTNVQSTVSSPKASDLSGCEDCENITNSFAVDHTYCSTVFKEEQDNVAKVIVESQQNEVLYCICRKPDADQFMIGCDNCDEWYHGNCIGITKQEAKKIKQYFCQACQGKNPELHTKFKKTKDHIKAEREEIPKKRSNRRCGECAACMIEDDCGKCDYCKDMRKFGGPNKKRQKCRLRQCLNKSRHLLDGITPGYLNEELYQARLKAGRRPQIGHRGDELLKKKKHAIKLKHTRRPQGREQKLKRQLSEKALRRKKRLASRDSLGASLEKTRQMVELPRQCYGPQCQKRARPNSKYCSHECGIQVAVRRIQEILPGRVKEWNQTPCVANERAEEKLAEIKIVQEKTRAKLLELDKESKELDDIIERATHLKVVNEEETDVEQDTDLDLTIYCVTCGIPLVPKVALRHMEKCYMKNESLTSFGSAYKSAGNLFCDFYNSQQGTYCKRLRVLCPEHTKEPKFKEWRKSPKVIGSNRCLKVSPDDACGCPLSNDQLEETGELCCVSKRNCVRHHCWEKLRRAQIDGQRVQQWLKLEEAYEQERSIRWATTQRGGVLGLLLHRTIVES